MKGLKVIDQGRIATSAWEKGHGPVAQSGELQLPAVTDDVTSSGGVPMLFGRQTAIAVIESGLADGLPVRSRSGHTGSTRCGINSQVRQCE